MNRNPFAFVVALVAAFTLTSCLGEAEYLKASAIDPIVQIVTEDLEEYLDAGIAPDGSPLDPDREYQVRGGIAVLRNAVHEALQRERDELPTQAAPEADETD